MSLGTEDVSGDETGYKARQKLIDEKLTPDVVWSIVKEHLSLIAPKTSADASIRHVYLVYASTAALLRRIAGGTGEKIVGSLFETIPQARAKFPMNLQLGICDGRTQFCVTIATALPMKMLGLGEDQIIIHSCTRLKLQTPPTDPAPATPPPPTAAPAATAPAAPACPAPTPPPPTTPKPRPQMDPVEK
jgi:hypothetical protein